MFATRLTRQKELSFSPRVAREPEQRERAKRARQKSAPCGCGPIHSHLEPALRQLVGSVGPSSRMTLPIWSQGREAGGLGETTPAAGCQLDLENRNDAVVAVDNDDLIIGDEIEVTTPFRMEFDQHRRDLNHAHRGGHGRSDPDLEVDVIGPWCIAALQHGFAHSCLLLDRQSRARRTLGASASLTLGTLLLASASLCLGFGLLTLSAPTALAFGALLLILTLLLALLLLLILALLLALLLLLILALLLALLLLLTLLNLLFAFGPLSLLGLGRILLVGILTPIALLRCLLRCLLSLLPFALRLPLRRAAFRSRTLLLRSLRCGKDRTCQQNGCRGCQYRVCSHRPISKACESRRPSEKLERSPLCSSLTANYFA